MLTAFYQQLTNRVLKYGAVDKSAELKLMFLFITAKHDS
jgi:hypothetical protein